jgi:hypothetical protein
LEKKSFFASGNPDGFLLKPGSPQVYNSKIKTALNIPALFGATESCLVVYLDVCENRKDRSILLTVPAKAALKSG